jgi:hypothetical protein
MPALLAVILFAVGFLMVGGGVGWIIEFGLFRWIERHYGVRLRYVSPRSPGWIIAGAKSRWQVWVISALHVLGIVLAIGVGVLAGFALLIWALPVLRAAT